MVDDDGPGIRPDALDKMFERFYTDRPEHGFGQNSGLGLSISKQIIEAHGGSIRVENRTSVAAGLWRAARARRPFRGATAGDLMARRRVHDPRIRGSNRLKSRVDPRAGRIRQITACMGSRHGSRTERPAFRKDGRG